MISSLSSMIQKPFNPTIATANADSQPSVKHRRPTVINVSTVTRIALAALAVLALCLIPTVRSSNTPTLTPERQVSLHSREIDVQSLLGPSALQLNLTDPRPKLLYLMAQADHTNSFPIIGSNSMTIEDFIKINPESDITKKLKKHLELASLGNQDSIQYLKSFEEGLRKVDHSVGRLIKGLDKNFDIRFKVIHTNHEMCEEIAAASKIDNFKSLIMSAHGGLNYMQLSDTEMIIQHPEQSAVLLGGKYTNTDGQLIVNELFEVDGGCFAGLAADATISLLSCQTGQSATGIASTISKLSQRIVWAPNNFITSVKTQLSSDIPPIPTFMPPRIIEDSIFNDMTCKFSPDGSSECGAFTKTKMLPIIKGYAKDYAPAVILSLAALLCARMYVRPWILRKNNGKKIDYNDLKLIAFRLIGKGVHHQPSNDEKNDDGAHAPAQTVHEVSGPAVQ